jgi:inner membrane protein
MEDLNSTWKSKGVQNTLKFGLIVVLAIFLLIPKFMILDLIDERKMQGEKVADQVSTDWSSPQILQGPVLVMPYKTKVLIPGNNSQAVSEVIQNLIVYPKQLNLDGELSTTQKYRSLYEVLLYQSVLNIKGEFAIPSLEEINIKTEDFILNESYLVMGINDLKGIENKVTVAWNGDSIVLKPGTRDIGFNQEIQDKETYAGPVQAELNNQGKSGLHGKIKIENLTDEIKFALNINLKGSKKLLFTPFGQDTEVNLKSAFPDPVFTGNFLPNHTTTKNGFEAQWNILEYNKILPSYQKNNNYINAGSNVFGVEIKNIVDHYTKINRAAKYMFLVIALVFLVVFITELINDLKIHAFQYALVGFAIALFFVLLLSISEFLGFDKSYLIAAIAIIGLITTYSISIFKNSKSVYTLLGLIVFIFSYIYLIIQLEKSALLVGSIGLFLILAATMYTTRKIKWHEEA